MDSFFFNSKKTNFLKVFLNFKGIYYKKMDYQNDKFHYYICSYLIILHLIQSFFKLFTLEIINLRQIYFKMFLKKINLRQIYYNIFSKIH
jgi:hypothetical protein